MKASTDEIKIKVKTLLEACLPHLGDGANIDLSTDLVELGFDSMVAIDLLVDLEKTFAVTFTDEMLNPDTFRTGDSLVSAIRSLLESDGDNG